MTSSPETRSFPPPTPQAVGRFYDTVDELLTRFQGGSMHYGYWTGPDDDSSFERASDRFTDIMIDKLAVKPGDRVLDLGCGTGKPATRLARATGAEVIGISISARDVELATARAKAEGLCDRVRFQHANALDLPFPAESFHAVLAFESIVHIPDRTRVLEQIARVLRPGGRLALTDAITDGQPMSAEEAAGLAYSLSVFRAAPLVRLDDYRDFTRDAGLELDELLDVSEHTKYTYPKALRAIREYAKAARDVPPVLNEIIALWQEAASEGDGAGEGVALVTAHRPE